jgi:hypothetical protein
MHLLGGSGSSPRRLKALALGGLVALVAAISMMLTSGAEPAWATHTYFCDVYWIGGNWCHGNADWFRYTQNTTSVYRDACSELSAESLACNSSGYYSHTVWLCYRTEKYQYAEANVYYTASNMEAEGDNYYREC